MNFIADQQTLDDLNLLGKFRQHSIFSIFNKVHTPGGEKLLEEMFRNPFTDYEAINRRSAVFQYFQDNQMAFPFNRKTLALAENYLNSGGAGSYLGSLTVLAQMKAARSLLRDERYNGLKEGLAAAIEILCSARELAFRLEGPFAAPIRIIFANPRLNWLGVEDVLTSLPLMARCDLLLRHVMRREMSALLDFIYETDVFIAVSGVARERGFTYATAMPARVRLLKASAIRHPGLAGAIANPIWLDRQTNMLFLTGANMAGKSTFMKSFGIAMYLAHMGFPVAAGYMEFSVMDGLFSSINVADNLNQGYSHFYAEVKRVKKVAEEVGAGRNLLVLFDELFKGTNVKDAYDATLACTRAFLAYDNCFYIISTHITEVGEALSNPNEKIRFAYMPTVMDGAQPVYTYRLKNGITDDRHGMVLIRKEGIIEMLEQE
ncbi:DNA mismatch repair protein [Chitinophaga pollutisoli]|uniref:DNA mismatch repair protein n=1 Tax=Chitinophaga pollutisoli TaxID=3133966 RepID=A0ABZ2YR75_9BACT